ncbi:glycosyltransferase [Aureimonas sp. AU20]|uniref:glycosyltransferase n=1 Tax=Aureimonas sp. AU20 TaxID=1349819 RepID=UPI00072179B9|nr:glycosyltransferase [Aureimonas sp. AU20]ALN72847.1 hypothetical protein M673_08970 [Aureimonas sp. AU20]
MASVSIVMATYNGARYIGAQLESLRAQTLTPMELIVADDGSSDKTLDIVRDFAASAPFEVRIKQNQTRLGYGENFLSATKLCRGDYVAFCDQDDEWLPEKLKTCIDEMERHNAVLCVHAASLIDGESREIGTFDQGISQFELRPSLSLPPWDVYFGLTQVFRRYLLDLIPSERRGLDNHAVGSPLSHDRWAHFLGDSFGSTVALPARLVRYRQHGKNAYGGLRKGLLLRLRGKLVASAEIMAMHHTIAAHRAALLREVESAAQDVSIRSHAHAAAQYWDRLARLYADRDRIYRAPRLGDRLSTFRRLQAERAYAGETGFGRNVLLKDFLIGVCRLPVDAITPKDAHTATTAAPAPPAR